MRSAARTALVLFITGMLLGSLNACRAGSEAPTFTPPVSPTATAAAPTERPVASIEPSAVPATLKPTPYPPEFSATPGGAEYTIPLTLQHLGPESAIVYFEIAQPGAGYLYVWQEGKSMDAGLWIPLDPGLRRHLVTIPGLLPEHVYQATVGLVSEDGVHRPPSFGGQGWDPIRISPPGQDGSTMRIGVLGDSGYGEDLTHQLAIAMAAYKPDFVIHTGDVVYKVEEEGDPRLAFQEKYFNTLSPVLHTAPLYPVVGNHEYDWAAYLDGTPYYFHAFPALPEAGGFVLGSDGTRDWYAIELNTLQIIFLNSQLLFFGERIEEQTGWLKARLEKDSFQTSILVFHVPPYSSSIHAQEGFVVQRYWDELFSSPGVSLVLSGHEHIYERLTLEGVHYLISGGGSSVLYPLAKRHAGNQSFSSASHFLIIDIDQEWMEVRAFGLDGALLDSIGFELPH